MTETTIIAVNIPKLKGKIVEKGETVQTVADAMGIDKATLYRKMKNDGETMLVKDANALVRILALTADEAMAIFFSQRVA